MKNGPSSTVVINTSSNGFESEFIRGSLDIFHKMVYGVILDHTMIWKLTVFGINFMQVQMTRVSLLLKPGMCEERVRLQGKIKLCN